MELNFDFLRARSNEARVEIHSYQKALEELNAKHTEKLVTITADVFNAKTILFKQG